jgi:hypothetical protein
MKNTNNTQISIFLILLIGLIFSNTASGGFFDDFLETVFGDKQGNIFFKEEERTANIRCKVEYTQLNLSTGIETLKKHTAQFDLERMSKEAKEQDICHFSIQYLAVRINEWLEKSNNNIIVNMTVNNCKKNVTKDSAWLIWIDRSIWGEYKSCQDEFNIELFNEISNPKQWGFNMHKTRLIKDYEGEFKD